MRGLSVRELTCQKGITLINLIVSLSISGITLTGIAKQISRVAKISTFHSTQRKADGEGASLTKLIRRQFIRRAVSLEKSGQPSFALDDKKSELEIWQPKVDAQGMILIGTQKHKFVVTCATVEEKIPSAEINSANKKKCGYSLCGGSTAPVIKYYYYANSTGGVTKQDSFPPRNTKNSAIAWSMCLDFDSINQNLTVEIVGFLKKPDGSVSASVYDLALSTDPQGQLGI